MLAHPNTYAFVCLYKNTFLITIQIIINIIQIISNLITIL